MSTVESATPPPPTIKVGLTITALVVVAAAIWLTLGIVVLKLDLGWFFVSFLFLWYWTTVEKADFKRLPHTLIGAVVGLAIAWLTRIAPVWGPAGPYAVLALIVVAVFVQVMNWVPIAVNAACMLFLTVGAIPALLNGAKQGAHFPGVIETLLVGAAFFAGLVWVATKVVAWRTKVALEAAATVPAE